MDEDSSKDLLVIVAEDDDGLNRLIRKTLERTGFETKGVYRGIEVLSMSEKHPEALLLLDYKLPDMTAMQVVEELRSMGRDLPFIVMTGFGNETIAVEMMKLGARDYIVKDSSYLGLLPEIIKRVSHQVLVERRLDMSEELIEESEQKYRDLFNKSLDAIFIHDMDGNIIDINIRATKLFGYDEAEFKKLHISQLHPEEFTDLSMNAFKEIMEKGQVNFEIEFQKKDGTRFPADVSSSLFHFGGRDVVQGIVRDITDRIEAQEQVRTTAQDWQATFDSTNDGISIHDNNGVIIRANKALSDLVSVPMDKLIGSNCMRLFHHCEDPSAGCPRSQVLSAKEPRTIEAYEPSIERWLSISVSPVLDNHGDVIKLVHIVRDITEKKEADQAIEASERKYSTLVEESQDGIIIHQNGILKFANNRARTIIGYLDHDVVGRSMMDYIAPESQALVMERFQARANGEDVPSQYGIVLMNDNGERVPVEVNVSMIEYEGKPSFMAIIRDITERKKAEAAIRASEEKYKTLVENAPDIIFMVGIDGTMISVNQAAGTVFGTDPDLVVGRSLRDLFPVEVAEDYLNCVTQVIDSGLASTFERSMLVNNRVYWTSVILSPIRGGAGQINAIMGIVRDITDRKYSEEAIKRSEERYRSLFEQSNDAIFIRSMDGTIAAVNPKACEMTGYRENELLGMKIHDLHPPEIRDLVRSAVRKDSLTDARLESRYLTANGRIIDVEISSNLIGGEKDMAQEMVRDITARKSAESKINRRLEIEKAVSAISSRFVGNPEIGDAIDDSLKELGLLTGASGVSIFLSNDEMRSFDTVYDWTAEGVSSISKTSPMVSSGRIPWFTDELLKAGYVFIEGLNDLPEEAENEHRIMEEHHIRSIIGFPLMIGEDISGFIVFLNAKQTQIWKEEDTPLLKMFAMDLGNALTQQNAEKRIRSQLEEKEVLLKEIHHRVKNNLQIISSLLHLQSRRIVDPHALEMFKDSQIRVRSMALVHEKVYESTDLAAIDFEKYVKAQVSEVYRAYPDSGTVRLLVDVKDIKLGLEQAIPCGLIITELVSNTLKHAFPNGGSGELNIEMHPENGKVLLKVSDTGAGIPPDMDIYKTKSLGLQLVNSLVSQLDGALELDRDGGTCWTIRFGKVNT